VVFDVDLDGRLAGCGGAAVGLVDRHLVGGILLAVLNQRVRSFAGEVVRHLVEGDVVLSSPGHARRMVQELVLFVCEGFVEWSGLGTCGAREARRAGAGVGC